MGVEPVQGSHIEMKINYHQEIVNLSQEHRIAVCYSCKCRGAGYEMGHSRAHAHCKIRTICLSAVPRGYVSFFTALHEIGHIVHPQGNYSSSYPRALSEHNATEWAKQELRKLGVPVRRKEMAKYNDYIGNKVARGLRRGLRYVPPVLLKYGVVG